MAKFICTDGNADIEIEAETSREAAQEYVDGGDWNLDDGTIWITVYTTEIDDGEEVGENQHEIAIDPPEPDCEPGHDHDWQSPYDLVGGIKENPGVWGKGGGVVMEEVCVVCGCARHTDTWAQNPENGVQGLTSLRYEAGKFASEVITIRAREQVDMYGDGEDDGPESYDDAARAFRAVFLREPDDEDGRALWSDVCGAARS